MINGNMLLFYSFLVEMLQNDVYFKKYLFNKNLNEKDLELKNFFFIKRMQKEEKFFNYIISKLKFLKQKNKTEYLEKDFFSSYCFLYFIPHFLKNIETEDKDIINLFKISKEYQNFIDSIINIYKALETPKIITLFSVVEELIKNSYQTFFYRFFDKFNNFLQNINLSDYYCYKNFFEEKIIKTKLKTFETNENYVFNEKDFFIFFDTNFLNENIFLFFYLQKYNNDEILFEKFKYLSIFSALFPENKNEAERETELFLKKAIIDKNIEFKEFYFTEKFIDEYNKKTILSLSPDIYNTRLFNFLSENKEEKKYIDKNDFILMIKNFSNSVINILQYNLLINDKDDKQKIKLTRSLTEQIIKTLKG